MWKGIEVVKPGAQLGDIGAAIQEHAEANNFSVVREFCGHGIELVFHAYIYNRTKHMCWFSEYIKLASRSTDTGNSS